MDSKTIVDTYEAKLEGQQLLWEDCDYILRHTHFKPINPEFDREALVHWWMEVWKPEGYGDEDTPYEIYHTWSNALYPNFKYARATGCYIQETNQVDVSLSCYRDDSLNAHLEDINMWLSRVKESTDDEDRKCKRLSILEHSLSQHCSYRLLIYNEKCVIAKSRGKSEEFDTLEEAVNRIIKQYYYQ